MDEEPLAVTSAAYFIESFDVREAHIARIAFVLYEERLSVNLHPAVNAPVAGVTLVAPYPEAFLPEGP